MRDALREDGVADADVVVERAADLRYVGQGYELRVPVDPDRLDEVWPAFHARHRQEYGHDFPGNPIELVAVRATGLGRTPPPPEPAAGTGGDARVGERDVVFGGERVRAAVVERARLVPGDRVEGPAIVVQTDTTLVDSAGLRGDGRRGGQPARAGGGARVSRVEVNPIDAQVLGGALQSIALEMGRRLARMSYSSIIRESEDFGAALLDAQGRQLAESTDSTPLQLGPIPGYLRGILRCLEERGETIEEGDVLMHNSPYHGASHGPDVALLRARVRRRRAHRLRRHHRPPPRHRRPLPRLLRHRRRRRRLRRGPAVQGHQGLRGRAGA